MKLGTHQSLSAVDFTTGALYLSINFNPGSGYDGEMSPRKQLLSAPFAENANNLVGDGRIDTTYAPTTTTNPAASIAYNPTVSSSNNALTVSSNSNTTGATLKVNQSGSGAAAVINGGDVGINTSTPLGNFDIRQITDGDTLIYGRRNTDSSPTGSFIDFKSADGVTDLFKVNIDGTVSIGNDVTFGNLTPNKGVFTDAFKNLVSTGTLGVDQGGTGTTTNPNNGQLLIGNGSGYNVANLTAGSGINIGNAAGSITVSSTLGTSVDLTSEVVNTLPGGSGGTGFNSYTTGDLLYAGSTGSTLSKCLS